MAVIVAQDGAEISAQEILSGIKDNMAGFKQPKRIKFVKALPMNAMGKVQKKALREVYAAEFK